MKTQISRDSFDKIKRYSGLFQQQGRMLTDADWNELVNILKISLDEALKDVVGTGAPRTGALSITNDRTIIPGDIFVDGIRAEIQGTEPLTANGQPDFPASPDFPPAGPYRIYADVWERTVTSLEDSNLKDPGLHGADTCTRTQTMLQVKRCPEDIDPETDIPKNGDAPLTVHIRTSVSSGDPCDPCAGLVEAGQGRVGNYLFRMEVHDIQGEPDNPDRLVLKWSSENGAEQYEAKPASQMPPGFVDDTFVYEFYNLKSEKHMGLHFAEGFSPARGLIKTSYEIPEGADEPKSFVRRWDGYCSLVRTGSVWSLAAIPGREKGQALTGSPITPDATGGVFLGSDIEINLESLVINLGLTGQVFLPGDFWLATVRESVHELGDTLLSEAPPVGIRHHFLRLAHVDNAGVVTQYADDAERRKHNFPPLTDLDANDVGYKTGSCESGLFNATHDTVKKALDRLCQLAAEHVSYNADCEKGLFVEFTGTVKEALDLICTLGAEHVGFNPNCETGLYDDASVETVHDALELLCHIGAEQISYHPPEDCPIFEGLGVDTVREAIDTLCHQPSGGGGGCRHTVGQNGEFPTLKEALEKLLATDTKDICICLLPGDHAMDSGLAIAAPSENINVNITGCGAATRLHLHGEPMVFKRLSDLSMESFSIYAPDPMPSMLQFDGITDLTVTHMEMSGQAEESALMQVHGVENFNMTNSTIEALTNKSLNMTLQLFDGIEILSRPFKELDLIKFTKALTQTAKEIAQMSTDKRNQLSKELQDRIRGFTGTLRSSERMAYLNLTKILSRKKVTPEDIANALRQIRYQSVLTTHGDALAITDAATNSQIENNHILGNLILYGITREKPNEDLLRFLHDSIKEGKVNFEPTPANFRFNKNTAAGLGISQEAVRSLEKLAESQGGLLDQLLNIGFFSKNIIANPDNILLCFHANIESNTFETESKTAGTIIANTAIYMGNRAITKTSLLNITRESQQAANLTLTIV